VGDLVAHHDLWFSALEEPCFGAGTVIFSATGKPSRRMAARR
jgi:hypothetical protein